MPRKRDDEQTPRTRGRRPPATSPEAQENRMINKAMKLAEDQLDNGTASAQVITHYLKLGSSREKIEQERIRMENELALAKIEAIASAARVEELYTTALNAMRAYSGQQPLDNEYDDD